MSRRMDARPGPGASEEALAAELDRLLEQGLDAERRAANQSVEARRDAPIAGENSASESLHELLATAASLRRLPEPPAELRERGRARLEKRLELQSPVRARRLGWPLASWPVRLLVGLALLAGLLLAGLLLPRAGEEPEHGEIAPRPFASGQPAPRKGSDSGSPAMGGNPTGTSNPLRPSASLGSSSAPRQSTSPSWRATERSSSATIATATLGAEGDRTSGAEPFPTALVEPPPGPGGGLPIQSPRSPSSETRSREIDEPPGDGAVHPTAEEATLALLGQVRDDAGRGIADAIITAWRIDGQGFYVQRSETDGSYRLELGAGRYLLSAEAEDHATRWYDGRSGSIWREEALAVELSSDGRPAVDFVLPRFEPASRREGGRLDAALARAGLRVAPVRYAAQEPRAPTVSQVEHSWEEQR